MNPDGGQQAAEAVAGNETRGRGFRASDLQARLWSVHGRNYHQDEAVNEKARRGVDANAGNSCGH